MAELAHMTVDYWVNPAYDPGELYSERQRAVLNAEALAKVRTEITGWPGYALTPMHHLPGLAQRLGVAALDYKDESSRFGLGSFKALGGAYAVGRLLCREVGKRLGREVTMEALRTDEELRAVSATLTVTTATDGNHGRSVAWGAQLFGCQCVIYIHAEVSEGRQKAIEQYGARVVRTSGNYDDAVHQVDQDRRENGWFLISDTSYPGYTDVPRDVMQGYQIMVDEAAVQLEERPTHIFVQAGVGALAAAVCAYFWEHDRSARPIFVVAEPCAADCLWQSAHAGRLEKSSGDLKTLMAGLACGEVSTLAWDILATGTAAFCLVDDASAVEAMKLLAFPEGDDHAIVAGESAVAGLVAAIGALQDAKARMAMGLDANSRILVFGSEGDTDPALYQQLVGATAEQVLAGIKLGE